MAPTETPSLASNHTTSAYPRTHDPLFKSNKAGVPTRSGFPSCAAPTSTPTTLSSTPSTSSIAGGNAADYDHVRGMLCTQPRWKEEQEEVLLQPYNYLASKPGKEIRSQMIDSFNIWLQVPEEKIRVIHKVIGMLHTSSLLVDDVEDNSTLRRGAPVAHAVYGVPQTINTANYVYFLVFAEVLAMNRGGSSSAEPSSSGRHEQQQRRIEEMIVGEMVNLHRGQGMDLYWRDNFICPTEAEYIEMVNNKTSGLLRIVIKLMVANSPLYADQNGCIDGDILIPLVNLIGLLFQIRDDFMNLRSGDYAENKGYCEDLTEGKFSFPLIHSIRADTSSSEENLERENGVSSNGHHHYDTLTQQDLLSILQSRPKDATTKRRVVDFMEKKTRSFEYTCNVMTRLDRLVFEEARAIETRLGGGRENTRLRAILLALRRGWYLEA